MARQWTAEQVGDISRGFQPACILLAAAELDVFGTLADGPLTCDAIALALCADVRGMTMLLDALSAMGLLVKNDRQYAMAPGASEVLTKTGSNTELPMLQHLANCLRSWAQLAVIVKTGALPARQPSIRGAAGDTESFIEAMEVVSKHAAPPLVEAIGPPAFKHLLDVGGGPGTWTAAFLQAAPGTTATLYDLPDVLPIAARHMDQAGLSDRVTLVEGNFYEDPTLPEGADLAWVSAIVHMNSRQQNRDLLTKVHSALAVGGKVLIRDIVMDQSRTHPPGGALFAINMLVNTPGGGTFTFDELSEDLSASGFVEPVLLRQDPWMNSVVQATKL